LERFLNDGRIERINIVQPAIRPQSITRKNALGQPRRRPDLGDHRHAAADD
jgi:hypothetical protein